ncbi:GNAT family N-acetyltransferase [Hymenobacter terrenus]|uniref:GNAT family N-acetyltransferase n=1 Tax=Hymenobacter terrenus TaxID=1629124 RepID=UPI0006199CB5|nr:GNAT family N-acetyltransferase [Hymenobacter terrenus]
MSKTILFGDYYVAKVSPEEWEEFFSEHEARVFPNEVSLPLDAALSPTEKDKLTKLRQNLTGILSFYFLIYENERPIGWHFGFQRGDLEYFMANTGILPEYQNRKIYSAFLKYAIEQIIEEGFQYITSVHNSDNNAVLVPKLKAGFLIQAMGFLIQPMLLETNYGTMIQLVYPAKDTYRQMFGPGRERQH